MNKKGFNKGNLTTLQLVFATLIIILISYLPLTLIVSIVGFILNLFKPVDDMYDYVNNALNLIPSERTVHIASAVISLIIGGSFLLLQLTGFWAKDTPPQRKKVRKAAPRQQESLWESWADILDSSKPTKPKKKDVWTRMETESEWIDHNSEGHDLEDGYCIDCDSNIEDMF